jgi:DNA (cytosine-5)-methyltransferase 1
MRALDLFCCQGGAATGLSRAGFDVVGVDIRPQPRYQFEFIQADALAIEMDYIRSFDLIWASPPCQAHSVATFGSRTKHRHTDLIPQTRELLERAGVPWIIENVPGAPLRNATRLNGLMFGLSVLRERIFETSFEVGLIPSAPARRGLGLPCLAGNGRWAGERAAGRAAMNLPWMTWYGLTQAIPPAYSEFLARRFLAWAQTAKVAA